MEKLQTIAIFGLLGGFGYLQFLDIRSQINLEPRAGEASLWPYGLLLAAGYLIYKKVFG